LIHRESSSRGHPSTPAHQQQFFREATYMQQKWGGELLCDPFYSPNFSLHWPGFDFACPPRWKNSTAVESTTGANDIAPAYPSSWPVFIS
jgi:hypothetical protein